MIHLLASFLRRFSCPLFLRDLLVGLLLLVPLLAVMTGSLNEALQLLLVSIVCTLGVGGLFWGLIAWGLGMVTLLVLDGVIRSLGGSRPPALRPAVGSGSAQPVITTYVRRRRQAGGGDDHIRADLLRGGWPPAEVEAALAQADLGYKRGSGPGEQPC